MSEDARAGLLRRACRAAVVLPVKAYQVVLSPVLGSNCRFHPTCSAYAITSVERFGVLRGGWMAVRRIARCHPFNPGGFDPVPESTRPKR